jgi:hypothetical protein
MAVIQFVRNYDDLSTDRGFQFKFHCDKCGNGYMSSFQNSLVGTAGSLLRAAGDVFGGVFSNAGNSAYEIQRAVGGKAHDSALSEAVQEGKQYFRQCTRCGKWVCPEVCWNAESNLCEECAPKLAEEMAAAQAQAKVDAARQQLNEKARQVDYVGNIDMRETTLRAPDIQHEAHGKFCPNCGVQAGTAKFCPNCGFALMALKPAVCSKCGFQPEGAVKFCPECGNHM